MGNFFKHPIALAIYVVLGLVVLVWIMKEANERFNAAEGI